MQHNITYRGTGSIYVVDEMTSLTDLQNNMPKFFNVSFGKRETFEVYRGFLIVRHTVKFHHSPPERHTVVYIYGVDRNDTLCVARSGIVHSAKQAKKLIDGIIKTGSFD